MRLQPNSDCILLFKPNNGKLAELVSPPALASLSSSPVLSQG